MNIFPNTLGDDECKCEFGFVATLHFSPASYPLFGVYAVGIPTAEDFVIFFKLLFTKKLYRFICNSTYNPLNMVIIEM